MRRETCAKRLRGFSVSTLSKFRGGDRETGVAALGEEAAARIIKTIAVFDDFCHANDLRLFIDGARLANAAAHLDCALADLAQYADVLSFGGTKNGALGAEAVVVMHPDLVADVKYLRKQQLQLASKMRFLSAQFLATVKRRLEGLAP